MTRRREGELGGVGEDGDLSEGGIEGGVQSWG